MDNVILDGLAFTRLADGSLFPVLTGSKGKAPKPSEPTQEERNLQKVQTESAQEQLRMAKEQQEENEALTPLLLEEYGLVRSVDPVTGKPVYTKSPDALTDKRKEIEGMQLDRSLKALKGELPVTVTLARELELGERKLNEKMSKQLGPGWETTTAGIQAKAEYERMATALKEGEQKDQLTTAEALSINRQQSRAGNTQGTFDTSSQGRISASSLMGGAGASGGSALNYYGNLRNNALEAKRMSNEQTAGYIQGGMSLVGMGGGIGAAVLI